MDGLPPNLADWLGQRFTNNGKKGVKLTKRAWNIFEPFPPLIWNVFFPLGVFTIAPGRQKIIRKLRYCVALPKVTRRDLPFFPRSPCIPLPDLAFHNCCHKAFLTGQRGYNVGIPRMDSVALYAVIYVVWCATFSLSYVLCRRNDFFLSSSTQIGGKIFEIQEQLGNRVDDQSNYQSIDSQPSTCRFTIGRPFNWSCTRKVPWNVFFLSERKRGKKRAKCYWVGGFGHSPPPEIFFFVLYN